MSFKFPFESLEPRLLLSGTVHYTIDPTQDVKAISRFIYGVNQNIKPSLAGATLERWGGNRTTAYNWENNASNAGADWYNQNDGFLGQSNVPGAGVGGYITNAGLNNAGALI